MVVFTKTRMAVSVAVFLLLTGNLTFFEKVIQTYPLNLFNSGFVLSIALCVFSIILIMVVLPGMIIPIRIVVTIYLLTASVTGYFTGEYGTIFNVEMIDNVMETHTSEALDVINVSLLLHMVIFGLFPVVLVWKIPIRYSGRLRELRYSVQLVLIACLILISAGYLYSDSFASFIRLHKAFRYYTNPSFPIYSFSKYLARNAAGSQPQEIRRILPDAKISRVDTDKELVILVLGETARKDRLSLYGYERMTNPRLSREKNIVVYDNVSACGTSTAVSVPCMFSAKGRERVRWYRRGNRFRPEWPLGTLSRCRFQVPGRPV